MYCRRCGKELPSNTTVNFCPRCGGATRIQEEQPKINLHTNTRNVELKNQDISEENNQITKTIGSHFTN
jgi:predicted RNA-binding Zn-ribbon protein involved in translation (DUF1610 family)